MHIFAKLISCEDHQNSNLLQNFIFDGQIKHAMKVAQKELNCNFVLLISRKHMHYDYEYCTVQYSTIHIHIHNA